MKNLKSIYLIFLLLISCTVLSAQDRNLQNAMIPKNIAIDNVLLKVFETGNTALLDDIISPEFINHTSMGDRVGIENLKTMVQGFHTSFKPTKVEVVRQLSDDEYVSDWIKFINSNSVIEGIELTKYKDGKAVEHWFFLNSQRRGN